MSRRHSKPRDLSSLAADLGHEDGTDPREFHRRGEHSAKQAGRKCRQLCSQVREAVHLALAGSADPVLQGLSVIRVEPAPHSGRLRIVLLAEGIRPVTAAEHAARAAGWLRGEVAQAIHRRFTPELVLEVI